MTDKEKFELANDFAFMVAIQEAEYGKPVMQRLTFQTIGDRMRLIEELEKAGFVISKIEPAPAQQ